MHATTAHSLTVRSGEDPGGQKFASGGRQAGSEGCSMRERRPRLFAVHRCECFIEKSKGRPTAAQQS